MPTISQTNLFTLTTFYILFACIFAVSIFSGFQHGGPKIMAIVVNVALITLFLLLFSDGIKFVLLAIDAAFWPVKQTEFHTDRNAIHHTRADYLKLRLSTLRSQLLVTEEHRNEKLNLMYHTIAKDLWLYGKYFFLLMCLVLVTREELLYYNTKHTEILFTKNQSYSLGIEYVQSLDQLYTFIESTLINTFEPNTTETGQVGWTYGDHTGKLGVVRLRQLRRKENTHIGWSPVKFSDLDYMPNWVLPYQRTPYTDKYWRIYEPWLPMSGTYTSSYKFFMNFEHHGYFQNYPELAGYATLLARSRNNSMKVVQYLKRNNWLTVNTSAVFMDFSLYNVDAHVFTLCTLYVEQTPIGTIVPKVDIISINLRLLDQLGILGMMVLFIYLLVLIQFSKALVCTLWYEPSKLRSMWNKLDLVIFILNICVIILVTVREIRVSSLLAKVEGASKLEFLDFRRPERLNRMTRIVVGFLVCLTTMRLWRVLQFASVFQLFTSTLYSAWQALFATAVIIFIFLMAFGTAVVIINGNNAQNFNELVKSIVTAMCFSFGFSSQFTPNDLFYGGRFLGLVLYLILAFVVAQLLINVFVSTLNDYFTNAKNFRDAKYVKRINFLQFLRVEYGSFFNFFYKLPFFKRGYRRNNRTVAENVKRTLDEKERYSVKRRYQALSNFQEKAPKDESILQSEYIHHIERLFTTAAIMQTQMELLEHYLFEDEKEPSIYSGSDSEDDSDESSDYN